MCFGARDSINIDPDDFAWRDLEADFRFKARSPLGNGHLPGSMFLAGLENPSSCNRAARQSNRHRVMVWARFSRQDYCQRRYL